MNGDTTREDFGPPVNPGLGTRMGTVVGRCELPMVVGTCRALAPSWYCDAQTGAVGMRTDSPRRRSAGASASLTVNLLRTFNEVALREVKWAEQNVGTTTCHAAILQSYLVLL